MGGPRPGSLDSTDFLLLSNPRNHLIRWRVGVPFHEHTHTLSLHTSNIP